MSHLELQLVWRSGYERSEITSSDRRWIKERARVIKSAYYFSFFA